MTGRRLLAVAAWLGTVTVVAGLVWAVIDRAGRDIGATSARGVPRVTPTTAAPVRVSPPTSRSTPAPHTSSDAPTPTDGPGAGGATPGAPTAAPTPRPSPVPPRGRPAAPPARTPSAAPPRAAAPAPAPHPSVVQRRFVTAGGTALVSCEGTRLRLDALRPFDGWRAESDVEDHVEVKFERVEGEGDDVEVKVECVAGVPRAVS